MQPSMWMQPGLPVPAWAVRCAAGQQKSPHVKGQALLGICCAAEEHISLYCH
jgi:hypothetical protein